MVRAAWAILLAVDAVGAICSPAHVGLGLQLRLFGSVAVVALAGAALERLGWSRTAAWASGLARSWAAMVLLLLASVYVTPMTSSTLVDGWLGAWGGSWGPSGDAWLQTHGLWPLAVAGYNSGQLAMFIVIAWRARCNA